MNYVVEFLNENLCGTYLLFLHYYDFSLLLLSFTEDEIEKNSRKENGLYYIYNSLSYTIAHAYSGTYIRKILLFAFIWILSVPS